MLRQQYGVQAIALFGSYARGEQTPESDLDLLVTFERVPSLFRLGELALDLEEAAGVRVDLCTRAMLKARIAPNVDQELLPV